LEAAGDAELAQDVGNVHARGLLAYVEGFGDLRVGQAVAEQRDDLAFARSQADRVRVWWRRGSWCGQLDAGPVGEGGDLGVEWGGREPACGRLGVL
jgi:hypothetical protein